jgi:hypothetical protein
MRQPKTCNEAIYQTIQIDEEDLENALNDLQENKTHYDLIGNIQIRVSSGGNYYLEIIDDSQPAKCNGYS